MTISPAVIAHHRDHAAQYIAIVTQSELQRAAQAPALVRELAAERKQLEIRRLAYVPSSKATMQG